MFKLLKYLNGYRVKTVLGPLFKLIEAVFELIIPLIVASIIDKGIPLAQNGNYSELIKGSVLMLILGAAGLAFSLTAQFYASRASAGFGTNLRNGMFVHINRFSASELDKFSAPTLLTRLVNDTTQVQNAVAMFIRLVTRVPFIVIGATVMALIIDPLLAIIFVAASCIVGIVPFLLMRLTKPGYRAVSAGLDEVSHLSREALSGTRVIRAFNKEDSEKVNFEYAADTVAKKSVRVNALSVILNPFTYAVVNLSIICILYFGGKQVYYGNLTQGQTVALINYLTQILHALIVFANLMVIFSKAGASAQRINAVLDTVPHPISGSGATATADGAALTFENVSFSYTESERYNLKNITFSLPRGQTLGILGGTGSGKTTLLSLIRREYPVSTGELSLFGNSVSAYTGAELRQLIGNAPQTAVLFSGTLRENLLWGDDTADDTTMIKALKTAQAYDFVTEKGGLDCIVEAGGKNFSGGQRQRLCLARAVLSSAPLLLLDDATSALDYATESRFFKALKAAQTTTSIVIVSQRVSNLKKADLILVLENGECVGLGTHKTLYRDCALYRETYDVQTKGVRV